MPAADDGELRILLGGEIADERPHVDEGKEQLLQRLHRAREEGRTAQQRVDHRLSFQVRILEFAR